MANIDDLIKEKVLNTKANKMQHTARSRTWDHSLTQHKRTGLLTNAETRETDMLTYLPFRDSGRRRTVSLPAWDIDVLTNSRLISWASADQRNS